VWGITPRRGPREYCRARRHAGTIGLMPAPYIVPRSCALARRLDPRIPAFRGTRLFLPLGAYVDLASPALPLRGTRSTGPSLQRGARKPTFTVPVVWAAYFYSVAATLRAMIRGGHIDVAVLASMHCVGDRDLANGTVPER